MRALHRLGTFAFIVTTTLFMTEYNILQSKNLNVEEIKHNKNTSISIFLWQKGNLKTQFSV